MICSSYTITKTAYGGAPISNVNYEASPSLSLKDALDLKIGGGYGGHSGYRSLKTKTKTKTGKYGGGNLLKCTIFSIA